MKIVTVPIGSVQVGDFMFVNGNRIEVKTVFQAKRSQRYLNADGKFEKGTVVLRGASKDDEWYAGPDGTASIEESKRPKAKFHVGQPVEYNSSDARCWCPAKIKQIDLESEDGVQYLVGPDDLWCLESEIRIIPKTQRSKPKFKAGDKVQYGSAKARITKFQVYNGIQRDDDGNIIYEILLEDGDRRLVIESELK